MTGLKVFGYLKSLIWKDISRRDLGFVEKRPVLFFMIYLNGC